MKMITSKQELSEIIDGLIKEKITIILSNYLDKYGRKALMITFDEPFGVFPENFIMKQMSELQQDFIDLLDGKEIAKTALEQKPDYASEGFLEKYGKHIDQEAANYLWDK